MKIGDEVEWVGKVYEEYNIRPGMRGVVTNMAGGYTAVDVHADYPLKNWVGRKVSDKHGNFVLVPQSDLEQEVREYVKRELHNI